VRVTAVEVSDPHDIERPFVTQIAASATGFASQSGAGLHFSPFGQRQSYVEAYAQLSKRALPERLPAPLQSSIVTEVELPAGWTATLPEGVRESGPQGAYEVSYARTPGKVVSRLLLTLNGGLLLPADYAAFRAFLGRLDEAVQRRVEALPAQTAARDVR
jgi:hypothetical protein